MPKVRPRVGPLDWLMLVLALVSVAMLVYETVVDLTPEQTRQVLYADYAIIAIFAAEFLFRWSREADVRRQAGAPAKPWWSFPLRNWYEVLGMIPVSHPAIRGFRLFRIIRIAVILSRFGRAMDRTFGEEFTARMLGRFKRQVVEAVSGAVTLQVLDQTAQVLEKGRYTANLADALEKHGDAMLALAMEKVKADPEVGAVRHLPGFETMVATSAKVTQRIAIDLLRDPRMDAIVKDILRDNIAQIQASVRHNEAQREAAAAGKAAALAPTAARTPG